MSELHPIEAAWRRFRGSGHVGLLRRAHALSGSYLNHVGLKRCPPEVALPGGAPYNLVALNETHGRGKTGGTPISVEGALLANTIHVWAAYRGSKTIYLVEPCLAECLSLTPWPERTPTGALRLRSRCPVLALPGASGAIYVAAAYDLLTGGEASGALELRICQFEDDLWAPICILHLVGEDLGAALRAAEAEARVHGAPEGVSARLWGNTRAGLALTLLLYLAGEPDIVRELHPGERPVKESLRRRDPERAKDLSAPSVRAVGKAFTQAIERWEIEHRGEPGVATGRTVRPHMRRAHSHLYWTGPGREQPRVRFLLPISVKGGKLVEEPEHPRETTVR